MKITVDTLRAADACDDLSGANLRGVNLRRADLTGAVGFPGGVE